ncbi:unnamed protein product [Brassica rapa subsp. narinosa]
MWSACCIFLAAGQPSDRLGEDVSESYKEFTERLASVEDLTKATMKKLIQGTSEHNKAMSAAKTDKEKSSVVLHAKAPSFIGDKSVSLSWKEATKTLASTTTGQYAGLFSCFSYVENLIFCMFYLANNDRVKRPATGAGNK